MYVAVIFQGTPDPSQPAYGPSSKRVLTEVVPDIVKELNDKTTGEALAWEYVIQPLVSIE